MEDSRKIRLAAAIALSMIGINLKGASVQDWGNNQFGQLGNGTNGQSTLPVNVIGLSSGVTAAAAGSSDSLAIQSGAAYDWGYGDNGELGNGTATGSSTEDGTNTPVAVTNLSSGVTAIAGGDHFGLAVKNGGVYGWGINSSGELGNGTTTSILTPTAVTNLSSGVTAIAAGAGFSLAIKNGAVYAWGGNGNGALGDGTTSNSTTPVATVNLSSGVTAIAAGAYGSLAIKDGGLYAWGRDNISGADSVVPTVVTNMSSGVSAIAIGIDFGLVVHNGNVFAWGTNRYGEVGNGTGNASSTLGEIDPTDLHDITAVAAGFYSSYALSSDGSLWTWGLNNYGQLALGNTTLSYPTPQHVRPPAGYAFISIDADALGYHAISMLALVANVASGQTYHFNASTGTGIYVNTIANININSSGAAIADSSADQANRQLLLDVGVLSLAGSTGHWTSTLNLSNNDLDLQASSLATVVNQLQQGYSNGSWAGTGGITSSSAATDSKHLTALGVIQNNQSGAAIYTASNLFDTITPNASDILIKYTYYGDTNLDGKVDGSDYSRIDSGYLSAGTMTGWFNGDFNYDGLINGSDYTLIDNAFNTEGAQLTAEIATSTAQIADASSVPEPTAIGLLSASAVALLCRRKEIANSHRVHSFT